MDGLFRTVLAYGYTFLWSEKRCFVYIFCDAPRLGPRAFVRGCGVAPRLVALSFPAAGACVRRSDANKGAEQRYNIGYGLSRRRFVYIRDLDTSIRRNRFWNALCGLLQFSARGVARRYPRVGGGPPGAPRLGGWAPSLGSAKTIFRDGRIFFGPFWLTVTGTDKIYFCQGSGA